MIKILQIILDVCKDTLGLYYYYYKISYLMAVEYICQDVFPPASVYMNKQSLKLL